MMVSIGINSFVKRQTEAGFAGTRITGKQLEEIVPIVVAAFESDEVKDGYAPFCKIVTIKPLKGIGPLGNILCPIAEITKDNEHLLTSCYEARQKSEFKVLVRRFPAESVSGLPADHIDVIVYTLKQLTSDGDNPTGSDFDIITVNAEMERSAPMAPMTMIRNALGKEHGGSGVELDRDAYAKSVEFWDEHAIIG